MITVCILTFNSLRTIELCLLPALQVADELIVVDSGSTDGTNAYLASQGICSIHRTYDTHARQMNFAISLAKNDWVLCLDSDEFMDHDTIKHINQLRACLTDQSHAYRITRHWRVLGKRVRAIYPVSSPDYPVRLFNRNVARFNDQPVDDKPAGFASSEIIPGCVIHDTFPSLDEVFGKANSYTSRLVRYKPIPPSLPRTLISPLFAFLKWYFRKGAFRDGAAGLATGGYAALYTFLKYFKAWAVEHDLPLDRTQENSETQQA